MRGRKAPGVRGTSSREVPAAADARDWGRRGALALAGASASAWAGVRLGHAAAQGEAQGEDVLAATASAGGRPLNEVTDTVFLDIALCDAGDPRARTLGATEVCPADASVVAPLGRLELGLYGNAAPVTVAAFKRAVVERSRSASGTETYGLKGTKIHKVGLTYVAGGRRGPHRDGGVRMPPPDGGDEVEGKGAENADLVSAAAFVLRHDKAGVLSLAVGENDEGGYAAGQQATGSGGGSLPFDYSLAKASGATSPSVEFLITTAEAPSLDGANIVFGRVTKGLGTLLKVAAVPTYRPKSSRVGGINSVAALLGDERADKAKVSWTKPIQTIVILDCGVVPS